MGCRPKIYVYIFIYLFFEDCRRHRVSRMQTPFSPREMTFREEQKLDPGGLGRDTLTVSRGGGG